MIGPVGRVGVFGAMPNFSIRGAQEQEHKPVVNPGEDQTKQAGRKSSPAECETCKNRKYQDGSDESDVSFQAPTHISPNAAASAVRGHEQEHVANAYEKEAKGEGKVLNASVSIHTAVCPECGRVYVSGGETNTLIAYCKDDDSPLKAMAEDAKNDMLNPYKQQAKGLGKIMNFGGGSSFEASV